MFCNPLMLGILKWGMAKIWSCGWALRKYKVKKSTYKQLAGLKNQDWGGLETPIHYWSFKAIPVTCDLV